MQNMVKEFKNFVFSSFYFYFLIYVITVKFFFINLFVYTFKHLTFIYEIYDVISFNIWL
ncbi:hypothetical protein LOK49_LG11G00989 [Camellia lanceoleosa]|uniref:Uncharacterized protein n=1 Tax=Camellia lanceoleosa TaxID=1840588 RepID=A0ACC0FYP4_9ERIC|nr:hypothetical protein LOK49_LG11G00989 [Camellia lanceoleosa]